MGARQVRGTGRAGGAGGPWRGRVSQRQRRRTISCAHNHSAALTTPRKSQLAIQYAHCVRDATPRTFVFWVHASTRARFEEAYRDLADRLELPGRLDAKADVLRLVKNWLCNETNGQWIIVLDNVDDVEMFIPSSRRQQDGTVESSPASLATYLPQSRNGSILITSRNKDVAVRLAGRYNNIKEVLAMDESQGIQLLRNSLEAELYEEGAALDLLHTLDGIPLAITQAAAYINRQVHMTISRYVSQFRANDKRRESLLHQDTGDLRRDESASHSVVTTWQMSFERIRQERSSAADLLSLMSFFNPQGIPEWTLRRQNRIAPRTSGNDDEAHTTFDEDLTILQAYSLIKTTTTATDNEMWQMHALVQFCTRVWLSSFGETERWKGEFLELLAQEFPSGEHENWRQCQQLLPHVEPLYETKLASEQSLNAWAQVLTNAAWYLGQQGNYQTARAVATKAVTAREGVFGLNQHKTLTSVSILALALQYQGKYSEAETLNRRALEGREKELGVQHPDTLTSVNNLALVLQDQGKYSEAETLNWRALEGREKELGAQHPNTLNSVYCLAYLLHKRRRYEEASQLYQRASDGLSQKLGSWHPLATACRSNFKAMQQEVEEEGRGQGRTLAEDQIELVENATSSIASLAINEAIAPPVNGTPKPKKGSLHARFLSKVHRKRL